MIRLNEIKNGDLLWDTDFGKLVTFMRIAKKHQKTVELLCDGKLMYGSWFEGRFNPPKHSSAA